MRIKDVERNILTEGKGVQSRQREYPEQLLNFDDGRVAKLTDARVYEIDENWIIQMKVKKLKKRKASGVARIPIEMLCFGGEGVLKWLTHRRLPSPACVTFSFFLGGVWGWVSTRSLLWNLELKWEKQYQNILQSNLSASSHQFMIQSFKF